MLKNNFCLNGEWDFMPLYAVKSSFDLPEKLDFEKQKIIVPSSWRFINPERKFGLVDDFQPYNNFNYPIKWHEAETGVYRKIFNLNKDMFNNDETLEGCVKNRLFLKFDGIMQMARIYLNGIIVGEWDEAYLPLEIDITDVVKGNGFQNEIIVICTEFEQIKIASGQIKSLGLDGSWFGYVCRGIWQDVTIESRPYIFVSDVQVKTSVRNNNIEILVNANNTLKWDKEININVTISDEVGNVKIINKEKVNILAEGLGEIKLSDEWLCPILWDMDNPYLYTMKVSIYEEEKIIDTKVVKFGFREIWTQGHKFILNGNRINLRGDSWHFQGTLQQTKEYALNWYKMCKENGLNFIRLHAEPHPEYYLDAADEVGMLIIDETAIYGSGKNMDAAHPLYISRCKKHVERLIRRDKNHPSIVLWSLENEMRWVDGRDEFKLHLPEMMSIMRKIDDTRPIILEGDNRLISKENTEIESRHYNIDGTIEQWDRTKPIVFGEHGGFWYVCPQNTSAYNGSKVYLSIEDSIKGTALKEKLYVEYARKNEVSGITSFNFAHYLMKSMPCEDVIIKHESLDTRGVKPLVIRKNSLTINNGLLKDYPDYISNDGMPILKESYKPVTIIASEYNSFFFDDKEITRNFDVYNDTLYSYNTVININVREKDGRLIHSQSSFFIQLPGEKKCIEVTFTPPQNCDDVREIYLEAVLYQEDVEKHMLRKVYKICPGRYKKYPIDMNDKKVSYFGNDKAYSIIKNLIVNLKRIDKISREIENYDILIIGSYISSSADKYQEILGDFAFKGGVIVQFEQSEFVVGDINILRQKFFSSHITSNDNGKHPVLQGLTDDDFIFWKPSIKEEIPESIIEQVFVKPVKGYFTMLLECSAGDFGDGGDLWTPLIEYKHNLGTMILNQLEIVNNYEMIPQACLILRNILGYAAQLKPFVKVSSCLLSAEDSEVFKFFKNCGLSLKLQDLTKFKEEVDLGKYKTLIIDPKSLRSIDEDILRNHVKQGATVLVLPCDIDNKYELEQLLKCKIDIKNTNTYQLEIVKESLITKGVPITDLFRYEKIYLTPRQVENISICENSIEVEDGDNLLMSLSTTPWRDYFVRGFCDEYSRIALIEMNKNKGTKSLPYLVEKRYGQGKFIISQVSTDNKQDKNTRFYSRLLANLGNNIVHKELFTYEKSEKDNSIDYMLALPHEEYKDYKKAEEYYSDSEYSLNNLGEGLYGWMKKIEKDSEGFINIENSSNRTYFLSCFVDYVGNKNIIPKDDRFIKLNLDIDTSCSFKLWVNGDLLGEYTKLENGVNKVTIKEITLTKGLNRFIIAAKAKKENIKLRPVFKNLDGSYPDSIRYQLTIDEVDPK